jgi:hypothetical protein
VREAASAKLLLLLLRGHLLVHSAKLLLRGHLLVH